MSISERAKLAINRTLGRFGYTLSRHEIPAIAADLSSDERSQFVRICKLDGCLGADAFRLFHSLSRAYPHKTKRVLEIGVFCGRSLLGLAFAFKDARVTGVDPFFDDFSKSGAFADEAEYLKNKSHNLSRIERIKKIQDFAENIPDMKERLELKDVTQETFLEENTERFDAIHIDGEHSYKAVFDIITAFPQLLLPDSLVIVDDMPSPGFPEISEAVYVHPLFNKILFPVFYGFNKCIMVYSPSDIATVSTFKNSLYTLYKNKTHVTRIMHDGAIMSSRQH